MGRHRKEGARRRSRVPVNLSPDETRLLDALRGEERAATYLRALVVPVLFELATGESAAELDELRLAAAIRDWLDGHG